MSPVEIVEMCPRCSGKGYTVGFACPGFRRVETGCRLCDGRGTVALSVLARVARGATFRNARIERREPLKDAAARRGVTMATLSRMEMGEEPVPEDWQS